MTGLNQNQVIGGMNAQNLPSMMNVNEGKIEYG